MIMKKLLFVSIILGLFLTASINTYWPENPIVSAIGRSALVTTKNADVKDLAGFAVVGMIEFIIITGAVYLFARSVIKSFGG